jgi:hypothetical protein
MYAKVPKEASCQSCANRDVLIYFIGRVVREDMAHQTFWKPEKVVKEKKQWKPGQKPKKEIPEWKKDIISHHASKPSTKDRGDFQRNVIEELIAEAGGKCQNCKTSQDTSTHHVMPRAPGRGGRGVKTNGMRLCWPCHDRIQTNEEELQYWISEWEMKYGPRFWFDDQDWEEYNRKQASVLEAERDKQAKEDQLEPIMNLLTIAAGRALKAKEMRLIGGMNEKEIAIFAKLMYDVVGSGMAIVSEPEFGYGKFDD